MLNDPAKELSDTDDILTDSDGTTEEIETDANDTDVKNPADDAEESEEELVQVSSKELKALKEGMMLKSDYTKKRSTEAAEHRANLAALRDKADEMKVVATEMRAFLEDDEKAIDWDILSPSETKAIERKFAARRATVEKAEAAAKRAREEVRAKKLNKAHEVLPSHFGWADDTAKTKDLKMAYDYAKSLGLDDAQINEFDDAAVFIAFIDAAKYRAIKSAKPEEKRKGIAPTKKVATASKASPKSIGDRWYPD